MSRLRFAPFPSRCSAGCPRPRAHAGFIRSGATTGDPKGRYPDSLSLISLALLGGISAILGSDCGSLGHKKDDESGLVYMRARYYEPTSGRFVSEDPDRQGLNWLQYSSNNPVSYSDETGKGVTDYLITGDFLFGLGSILAMCSAVAVWAADSPSTLRVAMSSALMAVFLMGLGASLAGCTFSSSHPLLSPISGGLAGLIAGQCGWIIFRNVLAATAEASVASKSLAGLAVLSMFTYALTIDAYLLSLDIDDAQ